MSPGTRPRVLGLLVIAMFGAQPSAQERPIVAGHAEVGTTSLAAARTFDAVSGDHRATTIGGGAHLSQLWRGLFVDVAISFLSKKGERVSVNDGEIVPLGAPLTVRLRHLDFAAALALCGRRRRPCAVRRIGPERAGRPRGRTERSAGACRRRRVAHEAGTGRRRAARAPRPRRPRIRGTVRALR
jgi:hypothetical protein